MVGFFFYLALSLIFSYFNLYTSVIKVKFVSPHVLNYLCAVFYYAYFTMNPEKKKPSPFISFLPLIFLVGMLFATIRAFGSDALAGGSQVALLTTTALCTLIGMFFYKVPWNEYEKAITKNISGIATATIILLIIGSLNVALICTKQIFHLPHVNQIFSNIAFFKLLCNLHFTLRSCENVNKVIRPLV